MPARILIVEDNHDACNMLTTILTEEGFATVCAHDGQVGLELAVSERPALILTDLDMPVLNGVAMIRLLRQQPATRDIPILVMSAYGDGLMPEAMDAGADEMIHKPAQVRHLIKLIKRLLKVAPSISLLIGSSACLYVA